ncbi:hypothetical protein MTO96_016457 [Rhipicephalus appendiculatus]
MHMHCYHSALARAGFKLLPSTPKKFLPTPWLHPDIIVLGASFSDLIQRMGKKRISVPDNVFYNVDTEEVATQKRSKKKRKKGEKARLKRRHSSGSSDEEEVEELSLLQKEKERSEELTRKNKKLEERVQALESRNEKLEDLLLNKLELPLPPYELLQPCPSPPPTAHPEVTPSQYAGASGEPPLFAVVGSEVHLGKGIYISEEKWAWLLSRPKDSLFCKEATKLLWGVSALRNRSLTGAPCRRFARQEDPAPSRRALTPLKLQAVANAFNKYVQHKPNEVLGAERLKKMNRFIAEMLNDLNK